MIRRITMIVCDICGFKEEAKVVDFDRNSEVYGCPDGWVRSEVNENVHFCPDCVNKLFKKML